MPPNPNLLPTAGEHTPDDIHITARLGRRGIDLAGDAKSLSALALAICGTNTSIELPLNVPVSVSPHPYLAFAKTLKIVISANNVRIAQEHDQIVVSGSIEKLSYLAQNIEVAASIVQGDHLHIEFYPSHFFLREDSIPLVVSRK